MKAQIVKIGNSQGIRIPKSVLEESQLEGEVELEASPHQLIVRSTKRPRAGWEEIFQSMAQDKEDKLLDAPTPTEWDETEWEW